MAGAGGEAGRGHRGDAGVGGAAEWWRGGSGGGVAVWQRGCGWEVVGRQAAARRGGRRRWRVGEEVGKRDSILDK